jgi:hypothetical protein
MSYTAQLDAVPVTLSRQHQSSFEVKQANHCLLCISLLIMSSRCPDLYDFDVATHLEKQLRHGMFAGAESHHIQFGQPRATATTAFVNKNATTTTTTTTSSTTTSTGSPLPVRDDSVGKVFHETPEQERDNTPSRTRGRGQGRGKGRGTGRGGMRLWVSLGLLIECRCH